jgi:hypothetical protein
VYHSGTTNLRIQYESNNYIINLIASEDSYQYMRRPILFLTIFIIGLVLISGCSTVQQTTIPSKDNTSASTKTPAPVQTITSLTTVLTATPTLTNIAVSTTINPDFKTKGSVDKTYYYIIDGVPGYIPLNVYTGVNDYIVSFGDIYTQDDFNKVIDNEVQREYIRPIVKKIQLAAKNPDDEARIAISLVQHIKYDANAINEFRFNNSKYGQSYIGRYPYTILYQNWGGICGEKSFLLVLLLKELGYGVALLEFDDAHHMAVGIKVPSQYSYQNTGYALVESTVPEIPTFDEYSFVGFNTPISSLSPPKIIKVSDGRAFDSINKEVSDAQIERTIYSAAEKVNTAAANVNAAEKQLENLKATVMYWKTKVENDLANRDMSTYQNDLQMYNTAYAMYENYYNGTFYPNYVKWWDLKENFQEIYMPKQRALEETYGMTSGINVGL